MPYIQLISYLFTILGTLWTLPTPEESNNQKEVIDQSRKSITFIMGEDEKAKNQYYAEATNFYRYNEIEKTDIVLDTCRSLWSIINYMEKHPPTNGLPWGKVNVVVHSNEWTGLSMPIFPNGERINIALLSTLKEAKLFTDLQVVDNQTHIRFQSCGLGRNKLLVNALQDLFINEKCVDLTPKVTASPYFVFYESKKYKGIPVETKKSTANVWYAFYKTGYREGDIKLSRQLTKRYPAANINWRQALKHTNASGDNALFHYKFTIPIEWMVTYETEAERPHLGTKVAQKDWLSNQQELLEAVEEYAIEIDKFKWTFKETRYTFEDGITEPAILAKGLCTVVCILQKE